MTISNTELRERLLNAHAEIGKCDPRFVSEDVRILVTEGLRLLDENAALVKERDELHNNPDLAIGRLYNMAIRSNNELHAENARLLKRIEALRAEVEEERRGTYCVAYNADAQSPAHKRACRVLAADDAMSEG